MPIYSPQLARLVKHAPEGDDWLHEMKYDGYRIGCAIGDGTVTLLSRNGREWTAAFPEIAKAALQLGVTGTLLDGEVAIVLPDGRTSFQALQNSFDGGPRRGLVYFVFDVLRAGGENTQRLPLERRKKLLLDMVGAAGPRTTIRYSEHVAGGGRRMFEEACRLKLEGIVSKRRDSPYKPGRADSWLKTKCVTRQEFVIGGFTDPEGSRQGIGALLVGFFEGGALVFAGKVGTGFTVAGSRSLRARLDAIEQDACPFTPRPPGWLGSHAHWVRPELVAEVVFGEWTDDARIRHASFQGLREDREPGDVRLERAETAPAPATRPDRRTPATSASTEVARVRITHPDRVIYPGTTITKLALARFYERMAGWMVPHLRGRPLTLVRCPDGIGGPCFYMKHSKVWAPEGLRRVKIQEKTKVGEYLVLDSAQALVALVQMNIVEIHTWNTCVDHVELPDRIVFDIDPGGRVSRAEVAAAARFVRRLLETVRLESFAKTTGGNGLHVVVPLVPGADWSQCLAFARAVASAMARHEPRLYTTTFAKAGRDRKILIDYLRNNRTNTSVAAYSARARQGAAVSTPLRWTEVTASLDPSRFTVETIERRLARRQDPWAEYWTTRQRLTAAAIAAISGV